MCEWSGEGGCQRTGRWAVGVARTVVHAVLGLVRLHARVGRREGGLDDVVDVVPESGARTGLSAQALAAGVAGICRRQFFRLITRCRGRRIACSQPGPPDGAAGGKNRRSYVAQTGMLKKPAVSGAMSRACSDLTKSDVSGWPELNAFWYWLAAS